MPSLFQYSLCGIPLEGESFQKYLSVTITSTLSWDTQCDEIKKKANKVIGVLQRILSWCSSNIKERAYLTLVRPLGEYATIAWSPYTVKGTSKIESIQRHAARFVKQDYHRTSSVSDH